VSCERAMSAVPSDADHNFKSLCNPTKIDTPCLASKIRSSINWIINKTWINISHFFYKINKFTLKEKFMRVDTNKKEQCMKSRVNLKVLAEIHFCMMPWNKLVQLAKLSSPLKRLKEILFVLYYYDLRIKEMKKTYSHQMVGVPKALGWNLGMNESQNQQLKIDLIHFE